MLDCEEEQDKLDDDGGAIVSLDDGNGSADTLFLMSSVSAASDQQLERCGRWLSSIPRDNVVDLRQTKEYVDFLTAFESLGRAHRRVVSSKTTNPFVTENITPIFQKFSLYPNTFTSNFLQHLSADDAILRILEFLECSSLIQLALTCSRFRQLATKSATQRTSEFQRSRQLQSVMQLLRAKEQIDGIGTYSSSPSSRCHVQVPILLLSRRIFVTNSSDPEYNGVYFCTGSNGNGFVFTKPRFPERRASFLPRRQPPIVSQNRLQGGEGENAQRRENQADPPTGAVVAGIAAPAGVVPPWAEAIQEGPTNPRFEDESATKPGQLLRCIIAKRFSNETILWYLSKEVDSIEISDTQQQGGAIAIGEEGGSTQLFSFWAKLMVIGDASPDICRYPSQSSILSYHNEGWMNLATNRTMQPPTVELLD